MGWKYTIYMKRSGTCLFDFDWGTNSIFKAVWLLIKAMRQFPIVDFKVRRGYVPCGDCTVDYCDKSAFKKNRPED